jgi:hypothetical protein
VAVVTGESEPTPQAHDTDWATIGYDTGNGQQLWVQRLATPTYAKEFPVAVGITPDGLSAIVTGYSGGRASIPFVGNLRGGDAVTVAYSPAAGTQQWVARYTAALTDGNTPRALSISDDGSVFVTEQVDHDPTFDVSGTGNRYDAATLAYRSGHPPAAAVPEGSPWLMVIAATCACGSALGLRRRASLLREESTQ